jgi:hypothetical protein
MPGRARRRDRGKIAVDVVRVRVLPDGRLDANNSGRYIGHSPKTLAQ